MTDLVVREQTAPALDLPVEVRADVDSLAADIRLRVRRSAEDALCIGRSLAEVRSRLDPFPGAWGRWLLTEAPLTERTARRMLRLWEAFRGVPAGQLAETAPSTLDLLAAAPPEEREAALERIAAGERLTLEDARELIAAADRRQFTIPGAGMVINGIEDWRAPLRGDDGGHLESIPLGSSLAAKIDQNRAFEALRARRAPALEAEPEGPGAGDEWFTPVWIFGAIRKFWPHGPAVDFASCQRAQETVQAKEWFGRDHVEEGHRDGLAALLDVEARFSFGWCNPPYSQTGEWIEAISQAHQARRLHSCFVLVNAKTETRWYGELHRAWIVELSGRIAFVPGTGSGAAATGRSGSVLAYLENRPAADADEEALLHGDLILWERLEAAFGLLGRIIPPADAMRRMRRHAQAQFLPKPITSTEHLVRKDTSSPSRWIVLMKDGGRDAGRVWKEGGAWLASSPAGPVKQMTGEVLRSSTRKQAARVLAELFIREQYRFPAEG